MALANPRPASHVALGETFRIALDTLRTHKLRSFLTLLGIILAVMTLLGVMSVVSGLNLYVADKIANLGANSFLVNKFGIITNFDDFTKAQKRPMVTVADYHTLEDNMHLADRVAAADHTTLDVRGDGELFEDMNIVGVTPNYLDLRAFSIAQGRSFTDADDQHRSMVCVIGNDVYHELFPNVDPVGKTIRIATQELFN